MTKPPETHIAPSAAAAKHGGHRLLSPARYWHPGDMIRLIIAVLVLAVALAVTAVTHATYAGASAIAVSAVAPSTLAGRVLGGGVHALSRPRPSPHSLSRCVITGTGCWAAWRWLPWWRAAL